MIGQLIWTPGGRGEATAGRLYGLPVLRAEADWTGFWGPRRLRRAGRTLRRGGAVRVLVPGNFSQWRLLREAGLRPVDPDLFLRAQSVPLVLAALDRRGLSPDRAVVALRGLRADRDMVRTAVQLCPLVRSLIIDAPRGGLELAQQLRREFGVPILPETERGQAALAFHEGCPLWEADSLELYCPRPAGLTVSAPSLEEEDQENLPLLAALWEGGKLGPEDIKIT